MTKKRTWNRLLQLRKLEEDLSRAALEMAARERDWVAEALAGAKRQRAQGRISYVAFAADPDGSARAGGLAEMERARRLEIGMEPRLRAAEAELVRQREEFLLRRAGRRQVETLDANARAEAELEAGRRAQQMLDDWYGHHRVRDTGPVAAAREESREKEWQAEATADRMESCHVETEGTIAPDGAS